jgi:hypothetical protein
MIEPSNTASESQPGIFNGIALFLMGGCVASAGWFSVTTSLRTLSKNVPFDVALFSILGLEAGSIASAYLFASSFRKRFYWLLVYLMTASALLPFSNAGAKLWFSSSAQRPQSAQRWSLKSLVNTVYELRSGQFEDVAPFFLSSFAVALPLVALLGTRPQRSSLSQKIASSRLWMKDLSNQIESTEGLLTWVSRSAKTLLFNCQPVDTRVIDFQRQAQQLRATVTSSLSALEVPDFIHETLMLRLIDMCGNAESTAFAAQRKFDQVGLLALNDCLDAVQISDLPERTKVKVKELLLAQFQHFHEFSRSFTRADGLNARFLGKETSPNARSKKTISTQA